MENLKFGSIIKMYAISKDKLWISLMIIRIKSKCEMKAL